MHDEANPSFVDMVDQTTLGHRWLKNEFDVTPKSTWQIDPFGHSTFQASMMSAPIAGYNSVLWARSDNQEIPARDARREEEFIWAPSKTFGLNSATYGGLVRCVASCLWHVVAVVRPHGQASPSRAPNRDRRPPSPTASSLPLARSCGAATARPCPWTWAATTRP
jgi:hypothetical protein